MSRSFTEFFVTCHQLLQSTSTTTLFCQRGKRFAFNNEWQVNNFNLLLLQNEAEKNVRITTFLFDFDVPSCVFSQHVAAPWWEFTTSRAVFKWNCQLVTNIYNIVWFGLINNSNCSNNQKKKSVKMIIFPPTSLIQQLLELFRKQQKINCVSKTETHSNFHAIKLFSVPFFSSLHHRRAASLPVKVVVCDLQSLNTPNVLYL